MSGFAQLTPEVAEQLLSLLRAGAHPTVACEAAGVDPAAFQRWMRRGTSSKDRPRDRPFRELRARVERARAEAEARAIAQVARAGGDDWRAAAWLLERQYPERWSRPPTRDGEEPPPLDERDDLDELAGRRAARREVFG